MAWLKRKPYQKDADFAVEDDCLMLDLVVVFHTANGVVSWGEFRKGRIASIIVDIDEPHVVVCPTG